MTSSQLVVIVALLAAIAVVSALLGRRRGWSGRTALSLAAVPLGGLALTLVFC
ncbi:MAG TPA: hypothetical protein VFD43_03710 [Planctomycetota bacterium]|nr:hypothetical protein [Planctomycetota bacterium]